MAFNGFQVTSAGFALLSPDTDRGTGNCAADMLGPEGC